MERRQVFRVLISVSNKDKLPNFAKELDSLGVEIVSTGGTSRAIAEEGINVISVEKVTNFPEMMGGRVKTYVFNDTRENTEVFQLVMDSCF